MLCKWCETEIQNYEYCKYDCQKMYEIYEIRKIVHEFARDMEQKMQEKDKKGYTHKDKSLKFLVDKLREERKEVDFELTILPSFEIDEELVDEAIMTMLIREKIKDQKYTKLI